MKYNAILWDLDGTLTDSLPGIMRSAAYAIKKMGFDLPDGSVLRRFAGPPLMTSLQTYCGMSKEQAAQAVTYFREDYHNGGIDENSVFPHMRALLCALKKQGCYMAVATGKPQNAAEYVLKKYHLRHFFDKVVGMREMHHENSKVDVMTEALQGRADAVVIGDRIMDVEAAAALGLPSIVLRHGYAQADEFDSLSPTHFAQHAHDLYDLLDVQPLTVPGLFFSMEGNDGCGKSTQMALLTRGLRDCGVDFIVTREPGGTDIGEMIRDILLSNQNAALHPKTEALLFAAQRAQHMEEKILPALRKGQTVVSDRFVDSSIAYQGAGRRLGMERVKQINDFAIDGRLPDMTVFLEISSQTAISRRNSASTPDRIERLDAAFHTTVHRAFEALIQSDPQRFRVFDATEAPQAIAEQVMHAVMDKITAKEKQVCGL